MVHCIFGYCIGAICLKEESLMLRFKPNWSQISNDFSLTLRWWFTVLLNIASIILLHLHIKIIDDKKEYWLVIDFWLFYDIDSSDYDVSPYIELI